MTSKTYGIYNFHKDINVMKEPNNSNIDFPCGLFTNENIG